MGLRPARCYRWDSPAYTRVARNPADSYIVGIPGSKITIFDMGNPSLDYDLEVSIVSNQDVQIRHNALEAARVAANKYLEKNVGKNNYYFKVRVYPHHVMRENVLATGAGADRVQTGMRKAFGKPIGRAARVRKGKVIMSVYLRKADNKQEFVETALKRAIDKLPGDMKLVVRDICK
ncbi:MAG TPA: 50S ribosomal protein L16 [Candidatus Altiarchaeales archaeon]|nr:50S ribosomal protein L16 [Candidatus Altiarchaeales archaeon]